MLFANGEKMKFMRVHDVLHDQFCRIKSSFRMTACSFSLFLRCFIGKDCRRKKQSEHAENSYQ